jgi:hypothetical protein
MRLKNPSNGYYEADIDPSNDVSGYMLKILGGNVSLLWYMFEWSSLHTALLTEELV